MCGDGVCSVGKGETCDTCATDCCGIVVPVGATGGIVSFCLLNIIIISGAVLGVSLGKEGGSRGVAWILTRGVLKCSASRPDHGSYSFTKYITRWLVNHNCYEGGAQAPSAPPWLPPW